MDISFHIIRDTLTPMIAEMSKDHVPAEIKGKWAVYYSAFIKRRFANEGNGEWAALSDETIRKRRKGKGQGSPKILRDTGVLFNGLSVGNTNNYVESIKDGVRFGYSNAARSDGSLTIRQLAIYHAQAGRDILVAPDQATLERMRDALLLYLERKYK
jgi:hypothetical protein